MKSNMYKVLKNTFLLAAILIFAFSCKNREQKNEAVTPDAVKDKVPFFKLSLAQWSLHKAIREEKTLNPIDFAQKAREMGFEGLEYVSQLYGNKLKTIGMDILLDSLKLKSEQYGLENLLIMVDGEGDLASPEESKREEAVENHKKWVDAAAFLGCHSIRVNLFGTDDPEIWRQTSVDGLSKLAAYAKDKDVNIIVENHGYLSSNAVLLTAVIKSVNVPNCGLLPDFGNFCLKREDGERWESKCIEEYDKYQGVTEMMPFAKAVSAKSYDFNEKGDETKIDYIKMLAIVKNSGYTGYIGVEYEGARLSEVDGILATKKLLIKTAEKL